MTNKVPSLPVDRGLSPMWRILADFPVAGQPESGRLALEQVAAAVLGLNLSAAHVERLKRSVARALDGVIEHKSKYGLESPVFVRILVWQKAATSHVLERNGGRALKSRILEPAAGPSRQPASRGLGFFLIEKILDGMYTTTGQFCHAIELYLYLEGE